MTLHSSRRRGRAATLPRLRLRARSGLSSRFDGLKANFSYAVGKSGALKISVSR